MRKKIFMSINSTKRCCVVSIITYFTLLLLTTLTILHYQEKNRLNDSEDDDLTEQACHFPQLALNNPELKLEFPSKVSAVCRSWFYPIEIENFSIKLTKWHVDCTAVFRIGNGDLPYKEVPIRLIYNVSIPLISDFFVLECKDIENAKNRTVKERFYAKIPVASIHNNIQTRERLSKKNQNDDQFNILILGMDSVSRLQFQRMLPKTYEYISLEPNSFIFQGYNILGDGTPQQLIPMLTGFKEYELPSTLYRLKNASFVDVYPFVWNEYKKNGYVTGYAEDRPEYGIWTFRLKGFLESPTDHYLTPFYRLPEIRTVIRSKQPLCIGNQTTFELFLSYVKNFWSSYPSSKKFFFGFFKQYTHDGYKSASLLDSAFMDFFDEFNKIDKEKNTIIVLMTDHGARFTKARQTVQGKFEERLPMMSWIFPKNFVEKYPKAIKNFKSNIHRLTTPFDIHATLQSLLDMNNFNFSDDSRIGERSISLFHRIPVERTCEDINLEPHWCSCLRWKTLSTDDLEVRKATNALINYINSNMEETVPNMCTKLDVQKISNAQTYRPNKALLKFSGSADIDGMVAKYSATTKDLIFYQINFRTTPNDAIYEATLQYSDATKQYTIDLNHISRLNAYGTAPACIERNYAHLRKFCLCMK